MILGIVKEPEVGEEFDGEVVGIKDFGAFVKLTPGKDGLLHITRVANGRVGKVEDVLALGDVVKVKVLEVDPNSGKISLDRLDKPDAPEGFAPAHGERADRPRRDRPRNRPRPRQPQQQRERRRQRRPHPAPPPRRLGNGRGRPHAALRLRHEKPPAAASRPVRAAAPSGRRSSSPCARWQAKTRADATAGGRETLPPPASPLRRPRQPMPPG